MLLKVALASNRAEHSGSGMVRRSGVPWWPGWAQSGVVPALLRSSTPSGDGSKALWLIPAGTNNCSFNWPETVKCTQGASSCAWAHQWWGDHPLWFLPTMGSGKEPGYGVTPFSPCAVSSVERAALANLSRLKASIGSPLFWQDFG